MPTYYLKSNQDYRDPIFKLNSEQDNNVLQEATIKHYDDCYWDYLFAWCNTDNLALHYGYWNQADSYNHHQALLNKNQIIYETAAIKSTDKVLDAGCGIGGSSIWMAREHQNQITGITISDKQISYANKHAQKHQVAELVTFENSDFCQTPYEDESFDVVWALESSCHALNKADFINEAYRLLRKGGRLVVCDAFILQREFNAEQWQTVVTFFNGWAVPNLCDREEFSQLITNCGFKDINISDISNQNLPSATHMYKVAKRLYPVQKLSQWLGLRSKAQTANYQAGFAQHNFFHDRLAEYCIFTATK